MLVGELNLMVVIVLCSEQFLLDVLFYIMVILCVDIECLQVLDVVMLLCCEVGIEIVQSGGFGFIVSIFMCGVSFNQMLILIDGVCVSFGIMGSVQIDQLMVDQIDYIEIVCGNVFVLYGLDVIGGVVQIFMCSGKGYLLLVNVEIEYGVCNIRWVQVGIGGLLGEWGDMLFVLLVLEFKMNGFFFINLLQVLNVNLNDNYYMNKSVLVQLLYWFLVDWQVGLIYFQIWGDVSYDSVFGQFIDINVVYNVVCLMLVYVDGKVMQDWKMCVMLF